MYVTSFTHGFLPLGDKTDRFAFEEYWFWLKCSFGVKVQTPQVRAQNPERQIETYHSANYYQGVITWIIQGFPPVVLIDIFMMFDVIIYLLCLCTAPCSINTVVCSGQSNLISQQHHPGGISRNYYVNQCCNKIQIWRSGYGARTYTKFNW